MARARTLKPGFFTNDRLGELEPIARLLFAGLWCHADREGRLENRPKKLKAEILPYDECDVPNLLLQLAAAGAITCYTVDEQQYIQIAKFAKHQKPHPREPASQIPPPTQGVSEMPREDHAEPRQNTARQDPAVEFPEPARPLPFPSPSPIPLSPIPHSPAAGKPAKRDLEREFLETFWPVYPVREGKKPALAAFIKARAKASLEVIMAGVERYRRRLQQPNAPSPKWAQGWLNDERWQDEIPKLVNGSAPGERKPNAPMVGSPEWEKLQREAGA